MTMDCEQGSWLVSDCRREGAFRTYMPTYQDRVMSVKYGGACNNIIWKLAASKID